MLLNVHAQLTQACGSRCDIRGAGNGCDERSPFGEGSEFERFVDFADHLRELPKQQWCNLFLAKTMGKQEAIDLKERISRPISQTLNALTPLYSQLWR